MLRYLPGILLVQLVTLALFWVNREGTLQELLLRAALPAALIAGVTALWFSALARMQSQQDTTKLTEQHFAEREALNRTIERTRSDAMQQASADKARIVERASQDREKLVKKTHQELLRQERRTSRRANVKVGLAFMSMTALGVIMLITELLTLGLLTITTAGGAMGGYLFRWRQTRRPPVLPSDAQLVGLDSDAVPASHAPAHVPALPGVVQASKEQDGIDTSSKPRIIDADSPAGKLRRR